MSPSLPQGDPPRRLVKVKVSYELLAQCLHFPNQVQIIKIGPSLTVTKREYGYQIEEGQTGELLLESDQFPEVRCGEEIPEYAAKVTREAIRVEFEPVA